MLFKKVLSVAAVVVAVGSCNQTISLSGNSKTKQYQQRQQCKLARARDIFIRFKLSLGGPGIEERLKNGLTSTLRYVMAHYVQSICPKTGDGKFGVSLTIDILFEDF